MPKSAVTYRKLRKKTEEKREQARRAMRKINGGEGGKSVMSPLESLTGNLRMKVLGLPLFYFIGNSVPLFFGKKNTLIFEGNENKNGSD